jgi:Xaa-Pro dipeptidase
MRHTRRNFLKMGGLSIAAGGFTKNLFASPEQQTQSVLNNMVSGVDPLTAADYENRMIKAQKLMVEHKIDGLFLSGSPNLNYFTNVQWGRSERTFGAVLNPKHRPIWICPAFESDRASELIPKGEKIRTWEEHESPFKLLGDVLKDLGSPNGRLALGPTIRSFVYYGLKSDASNLDIVDGAVITEGCRSIKTVKEVAYMDLANRITKLAYQEAFKNLQRGMTARALSTSISSAHRQMGARGSGGPQFGPNTAFPHGSSVTRDLHDGDIIMVDGGCDIEGFQSDVTRTIVFGQPTDKQKKVWDIVKKAQSEAYKAVRPGVACEDIDRAARKVIEDAGFGPDYKYFGHRVGHGIGMQGHEYPYLVRGNKLKLQPGMTFSNEPGIYILGEFGIRIEDCFVVTEDGALVLGGMESVSIDKPFS